MSVKSHDKIFVQKLINF